MRMALPLLLLVAAGCGRSAAWKDRFLREVNAHYQTQVAKDAEIAALRLEIEDYRLLNANLEGQIELLEQQVKLLEGASRPKKSETPIETPKGSTEFIKAKVTAVATSIDLFVISAGRDNGVTESTRLSISRQGEPVGTAIIDRLEAKWAAAKITKKTSNPRVGDDVTPLPHK